MPNCRIGVAGALAGAVVFLLAGTPVMAHVAVEPLGGFDSGFAHPLFGADHFLAMFAIGVWGAQMGGSSVWTLPVTFPLIMVVGGIAGMAGIQIPFAELGIGLSVAALGAAIAFAWRPPNAVALTLVAIFALFHGYAHGKELPLAADEVAYATGFVMATGLIHLLGIGVGVALRRPLNGTLARSLGGLVAIAGAYFIVQV